MYKIRQAIFYTEPTNLVIYDGDTHIHLNTPINKYLNQYRPAPAKCYAEQDLNSKLALCPPNPELLQMATSI